MGIVGKFFCNCLMAANTNGVPCVGVSSRFKGIPININSTDSLEIYSLRYVIRFLLSIVANAVAIIFKGSVTASPVLLPPLSTLNSPRPSFPVVSAPLQPIVPAPLPILSSPSPSFPVVSTPVPTLSNQGQQLPVLQSAPVGNSFPLPVPNSNVPSDNTSQMRRMPGSQTATVKSDGSPSQRVASVGQIDLRYRVVVTVGTQKDQKIVKFIAPRAFRTVWHGQEVMQVGVFGSRYNANHMVKILHNKGLRAVVEPIN